MGYELQPEIRQSARLPNCFNPRMECELQRVESNRLEKSIVSIPVWGTSCNLSIELKGYLAGGFNPRMGYELQL